MSVEESADLVLQFIQGMMDSGDKSVDSGDKSVAVEESADFFQGMMDIGDKSVALEVPSYSGGRRPGLHRRNNSMDGASSSFEADSFLDGVKKVITPDKLTELALLDPKRAKKLVRVD